MEYYSHWEGNRETPNITESDMISRLATFRSPDVANSKGLDVGCSHEEGAPDTFGPASVKPPRRHSAPDLPALATPAQRSSGQCVEQRRSWCLDDVGSDALMRCHSRVQGRKVPVREGGPIRDAGSGCYSRGLRQKGRPPE